MTALERLLAAYDAGKVPADGTVKNAVAEIDENIRTCREFIKLHTVENPDFKWDMETVLDLFEYCVGLKNRLEANKTFNASVTKIMGELSREAPKKIESLAKPMTETLCSKCEKREAKIWNGSKPYCKRCARDQGIEIHGKV